MRVRCGAGQYSRLWPARAVRGRADPGRPRVETRARTLAGSFSPASTVRAQRPVAIAPDAGGSTPDAQAARRTHHAGCIAAADPRSRCRRDTDAAPTRGGKGASRSRPKPAGEDPHEARDGAGQGRRRPAARRRSPGRRRAAAVPPPACRRSPPCESGGDPTRRRRRRHLPRQVPVLDRQTWASVGGSGDPRPPPRPSRTSARRCCTRSAGSGPVAGLRRSDQSRCGAAGRACAVAPRRQGLAAAGPPADGLVPDARPGSPARCRPRRSRPSGPRPCGRRRSPGPRGPASRPRPRPRSGRSPSSSRPRQTRMKALFSHSSPTVVGSVWPGCRRVSGGSFISTSMIERLEVVEARRARARDAADRALEQRVAGEDVARRSRGR